VAAIGFTVRFYNAWKLRKYEALQQVSESHRQALQHTPSVTARRDAEIPFGIRAIQSGIQVDGVWISGSNTPVQSGPNSRAPSIILGTDLGNISQAPERAAAAPSKPRLEIPQPAHRQSTHGQSSTSSRDSTHPYGGPSDRLSAEYLPRGRPTYQPRRSSGLRYSNIDENSDALDALEGRRQNGTIAEADVSQGMRTFISRIRREQPGTSGPEPIELTLMPPKPGFLLKERSNGSSNVSSASSSGDEQHYAPRHPRAVRVSSEATDGPAHRSYTRQYHVDPDQRSSFDALAHHRRSQGAEEGQLHPRNRLSGTTGIVKLGTPAEHRYSFEEEYPVAEASDPFMTPLGTPMACPIQSMEEPPSFANFVNANPLPESHIALVDDSEETSPFSQESAPPLQRTDGNRQAHRSQVIRKINSGFEILQPGSLSQPQKNYAGDWNRDLERGNEQDLSTTKVEQAPKKLQRKRADSKESRFKEQV